MLTNKMPQCISIKTDGERCTHAAKRANTRCGTHIKTFEKFGPNTTARFEKEYQNKKAIRDLTNQFMDRYNAERDARELHRLEQDMDYEIQRLRVELSRQLDLLIRQQQDEIARTGIDPDVEYRRRYLIAEEERRAARNAERQEARFNHANAWVVHNNIAVGVIAAGGGAPQPQVDELLAMARDNQSVHRTRVVEMTKQIVDRILKIPVPDEYKWNPGICSKTPGEIVIRCKLTPRAAWQMISKYCNEESIYEMGVGIYGKVLDGVWQYILKMDDSDGICRALRQEMEDSIGMCAQGNLTRICNILAGFMEGVGSQETIAEILGRKLPSILEIMDPLEQVNRAIAVFEEVGLPKTEWKNWMIAITDSMTEDDLNIVKPRLVEAGVA